MPAQRRAAVYTSLTGGGIKLTRTRPSFHISDTEALAEGFGIRVASREAGRFEALRLHGGERVRAGPPCNGR
jgi:hypothetical protein